MESIRVADFAIVIMFGSVLKPVLVIGSVFCSLEVASL